jgi:predicted amidophosphoribosyltransferase
LRPAPATTLVSVDRTVALWRYDDASAPLITAAKGLGGSPVMRRLAVPLAQIVEPHVRESTTFTWIPPSDAGRRRRGFDQGRMLASTIARSMNVAVAPAFTRSGRAQFGGSRSVRLQGPRLRLRADWSRASAPEHIILVDDVITTGASMSSAALLLRERLPALDIVAAALAVRV